MTERTGPVLVTGASSGIGRAITEHLSAAGHAVFATARKKSDLERLAELPLVTPIRLDVTRQADVENALRTIRASRRGLYGLVNNAGVGQLSPLVETSLEEVHRVLDVNLYGLHRMVRACFSELARSRGRIVNISSINGISPFHFSGAYCASKFAVEAYSDVLRDELARFHIRVILVEPGAFRSNITSNLVARKGTGTAAWFGRSPEWGPERRRWKRVVETPEESRRSRYPEPRPVAEAVADALFSRSPRPRYLVGASQGEVDWTIGHVLSLLHQLNQGHEHSVSTDELADRLRRALG